MPRNGRSTYSRHDPYGLDAEAPVSRFEQWEVDPELIWGAIRRVSLNGHGILFRPTSDGGAMQVTIYRPDEEPQKRYCADVAAFTSLLSRVRGNPLD